MIPRGIMIRPVRYRWAMHTSGLEIGFGQYRVRHLAEAGDSCIALCGADLHPGSRSLTVLDLPWLGCEVCWDLASGRIRTGLID